MFDFARKLFTEPTLEERMKKEKQMVEEIFSKVKNKVCSWANDPIGYRISIYIGILNNRIREQLEEKVRDHICRKYNCLYVIRRDGFLVIEAEHNTSELILKHRKG